jgi:DNA ligase (NAD+)
MAEKSAGNLLSAIEKSKSGSLSRLIFALGIRHVGIHAAEVIASRYSSLEELKGAGVEELEAIPEIGPVMAKSICSFFRMKGTESILERLASAGVRMEEEKAKRASLPLVGKSFVFTGTLERRTRSEAEGLVRKRGGRTSNSVSRNTDYVVAGKNPGSKKDRAAELNVTILTEGDFERLVG